MVLRRRLSGPITVPARLFNILLVALACLPVIACSPTKADQMAGMPDCDHSQLEIDEKQMSYVKDSVQKFFQWEAYWTYTDQDSRAFYNEKINQSIPIQVFSLSHGLIVFVPGLENSVIAFSRSANGIISNPRFVRGGPSFNGSFEGDKLLAMAKALGSWREFISFTGKATEKEPPGIPLLIPEDDMKRYIDRNRGSIKYCQRDSNIKLLALNPVTYDPMDEKKQSLLEAIVKASIGLAKTMFGKGVSVTIIIPDFNINDGGIWIQLEERHGEAYTMGMNMDLTNTDAPVTYAGTVEIKSNPRYGIRLGADEKIKENAVKTLRYKIQ